MATVIKNKKIIHLDSVSDLILKLNENVAVQNNKIENQERQTQKIIHQLRIQNMYKAHENDLVIDSNIFENDELD